MGLARDRQTVILAGAGCEAGARRWRRGAGVVLVCVGGGEERSGRDGAAGMEQGGGGGAVRSGACGAAGHGATLECLTDEQVVGASISYTRTKQDFVKKRIRDVLKDSWAKNRLSLRLKN
ncbi:Protein of unknown function [Gryllus bimaculatus]|nr:Protein of unknown function [Gryllus bimaculatus]